MISYSTRISITPFTCSVLDMSGMTRIRPPFSLKETMVMLGVIP